MANLCSKLLSNIYNRIKSKAADTLPYPGDCIVAMSDFKHENLQGEISHRYDRPNKGRKKYAYSIVSPLFPPFMAIFCVWRRWRQQQTFQPYPGDRLVAMSKSYVHKYHMVRINPGSCCYQNRVDESDDFLCLQVVTSLEPSNLKRKKYHFI